MSSNYNNYIYKYELLKAKADYHLRSAEVFTSQIDNETDPCIKKRLCARRSHHRRLYRKYYSMAENAWLTMR